MFIAHLVFKCIKPLQKTNGKGRTRAQTSTSRKVRDVMDFNSFVDPQVLQTTSDGWMFDRPVLVDVLDLRIRDAAVVFEKRRQTPDRDVAALIDRRCENSATELPVPDWIVSSSAKK